MYFAKLLVNTKENESSVTLHLFVRRNLLQRKVAMQAILHLQIIKMDCLMVMLVFKMGLLLDLKMKTCRLTKFEEHLRPEDAMPIEIKPQILLHLFEPVQVPG